ncbi:hypothetical protein niasHT_033612 [Heterodera trifolii]|uniref:Uncharacterized protein n=1 Tax=Heterodera trifolii TaxID=157864 RepID=A0ABD2I5A0_9BILA
MKLDNKKGSFTSYSPPKFELFNWQTLRGPLKMPAKTLQNKNMARRTPLAFLPISDTQIGHSLASFRAINSSKQQPMDAMEHNLYAINHHCSSQ